MSLINLFVAARSALAHRHQQRVAYDELMSLDDRSLADIGIHRSQIPGLVEGFDLPARGDVLPETITASAFGAPHLATGRSSLPPI